MFFPTAEKLRTQEVVDIRGRAKCAVSCGTDEKKISLGACKICTMWVSIVALLLWVLAAYLMYSAMTSKPPKGTDEARRGDED